MAYQVLPTKLYNHPIKPGLVRRPRLVQRLEAGYQAGKRVTRVSAPAGFGKTTLISEWITGMEPGKPFGWVSLDDGDNDPLRFLTYLVAAIQKVDDEIGRSILLLLQSSQNPNLIDLVEALINEISAAPKLFLIVLDDIHARYARQLLASFNRQPFQEKISETAAHWNTKQGDLVESLSERELEVLRLLAQGLTPARVAKQLVLSPNTLKAHTQNIYSKLDVHTRIEAIYKACELELI